MVIPSHAARARLRGAARRHLRTASIWPEDITIMNDLQPAFRGYVEGLIMWSAAVVVDIHAGQAPRLGDGLDIIRAV